MPILDQPEYWNSVDPQAMRSLIESFPEQVENAVETSSGLSLPVHSDAKAILITGLGGSAIGGDLVRSMAETQLKIPITVNRNYDLPRFVDSSTLVLACSYSGNTEETLSAYKQAKDAKAIVVSITSGGRLESMARADGCPVIRLPGGLPPRAALGYALITLMTAMQSIGLLPGQTESFRETIALLRKLRDRYGISNPETGNPAKKMARSLNGKIVAIYGSNGIMEPAAYRWRSQIAENAKNLALHHYLPEMNHNELVGWLHPKEALLNVGVVFLRDKGEHPQVRRRFELTQPLIAGKSGALFEIWSEGESLLARVLSVVYLGDFVSLYLAYLNNADPTPVDVIENLKNNLRM